MALNDSTAIDYREVNTLDYRYFIKDKDTLPLFFMLKRLCAMPILNGESNSEYSQLEFHTGSYYPVTNISYRMACQYCDSVGKVMDKKYQKRLRKNNLYLLADLPTIDEWQSSVIKYNSSSEIIAADVFSTSNHRFTDSLADLYYCHDVPLKIYMDSMARMNYQPHDIDILHYFAALTINQKRSFFYTLAHTHDFGMDALVQPNQRHNLVFAKPYAINTRLKKPIHLIGNVAEMVKEQGKAVGGSFRDSLIFCNRNRIEHYDKPQYWIGFRCAYKLKRKF